MKIIIEIEATDIEEAVLAAEEATRQMSNGCTSGFNGNETSSYTFEVDEKTSFEG